MIHSRSYKQIVDKFSEGNFLWTQFDFFSLSVKKDKKNLLYKIFCDKKWDKKLRLINYVIMY